MGRIIANKVNRRYWTAIIGLSTVFTVLVSLFLLAGAAWATYGVQDFTTCGDCHGYPPADGNGRNNPAGLFPGSHATHSTDYGTQCTLCHIDNGSNYAHRSGNIDMNVSVNYGRGDSFVQSNYTTTVGVFGNCTTNNCHGTASPTWGANTASDVCVKCHGISGSSDGQVTTDMNRAAPGYTAASAPTGSGRTTGGATAASDVKVGSHDAHLRGLNGYSNAIVCTECHVNVNIGNVTFSNHMNGAGNLDWGDLAKHNSAVYPIVGQNLSPVYAGGGGTCTVTYCHGGGAFPADGSPSTKTVPDWNTSLLAGAGAADCSKCHGNPPNTGDHSTASANVCNGCHTHVNDSATAKPFFNDLNKHINGIIDVDADCVSCHSAVKGARAAAADQLLNANSHHVQVAAGTTVDGTYCYRCHWEADSTGKTTGNHGGSSNPGSGIDLIVWGASTTRPTTDNASTHVTYTASVGRTTANYTNINTHCIGCHNDTNLTTQAFPSDIYYPSRFAYDGRSIDSRYSQSSTTPWGKYPSTSYNVTAKDTQNKALSAHGRADLNARGWGFTTSANAIGQKLSVQTFPNTSGAVNVLCFDCHNSHGSNAGDATHPATSYAIGSTGNIAGGLLKDVTNGLGGFGVTYKPTAGGSTAGHNVYNSGANLCFDCHENQAAGTAVAGGSTPWGYGGTFSATQAITAYQDKPKWDTTNTTATIGPEQRFAFKQSHNHTTGGGHFGKSSTLTDTPTGNISGLCTPCHDPHGVSKSLGTNSVYAVPLLKGTWITTPYKEDAAPVGSMRRGGRSTVAPPGSGGWIGSSLLGAKRISGGTDEGYHIDQNTFVATTVSHKWTKAAPTVLTQTPQQFAGLCLSCHSAVQPTFAGTPTWKSSDRIHNSVKGWAGTATTRLNQNNYIHSYTCSKCHTPHTSQLPRLMVTNCLDVKHKNQIVSGGTAIGRAGSSSRGTGWGRFPGGGGGNTRATTNASSYNQGRYFFGTGGTTTVTTTKPPMSSCHTGPDALNTDVNGTAAVDNSWNSRTPW